MDLDGDGIADVVSGSWPGELYFFKGLGKGKYAAAETLTGKDGKKINVDRASTVFAADWRGTGRVDLLVGGIDGFVWLVPDESEKGKAAYGKPVQLKAAGKEIQVAGGDSHPVVADWEGTGKPGLVVGCGDGGVLWFRNEGTKAEPKLAAAVTLVTAPKEASDKDAKQKGPTRGTRAKVWVGDWNGDGHLDLLVGDFSMSYGEAPKMTDADKKRQKELQEKQSEADKALAPYIEAIGAIYKDRNEKKMVEGEFEKKMTAAAEKYKKELAERNKLYSELSKFERPYQYHGYVWVFLREATASASRWGSGVTPRLAHDNQGEPGG